jgi:hypothetical protein
MLVSILMFAAVLWTPAAPTRQPARPRSQPPAASPEVPSVQRLKAWLAAFNSGDRAQ